MTAAPADYVFEVYRSALDGKPSALPWSLDDLERRAVATMSSDDAGRVLGGAGTEATVRANRAAFERWRILPRVMRDVSRRDLRVTVCGTELSSPLLLAPIGVQSALHPDGEVATARGAAAAGVLATVSTHASTTIEDFAAAMGAAPRWFQLYWPKDDELARSFVSRAEAAGYAAIVITLGTRMHAWRPRELDGGYYPIITGAGMQNYFADPVFRAALDRPPDEDHEAAVRYWLAVASDPTLSWERIARVREITRLPIIVKGILHPDDARVAVEHGMDGIIVSNYGGRQVDGAVSTLEMLPAVVDAVPDGFPVLLDGGVRCAADAFKALALGARAVGIGRLYLWALALGGEEGVEALLRRFLAELDITIGLSGYRALDEIGPDALVRG